jgi:hypothetical protein
VGLADLRITERLRHYLGGGADGMLPGGGGGGGCGWGGAGAAGRGRDGGGGEGWSPEVVLYSC